MIRTAEPRVLAGMAIAASLVAVACSSSSGKSSAASGGSGGHAGTAPQGGTTAQAGTVAQAGSDAQAGATAGGAAGTAGSVAQAGSSGANADPCQAALFCDDFEAYPAGSPPGAPWASNMNGGSVAIDTTHAHSGARAVKISAAAAMGYRSALINLQKTMFLPPPNNVIYGRMMFWLDSAPQTSVHWTFIDGEGKVPGQAYHSVYRYGGQAPIMNGADFVGSQLMGNYDTPDSYATPAVGPGSDCWLQSDKVVVPVAAWACAEWKFDGAANKMQFWLNGSEVTSLAMNGTGQGCIKQPTTFPWTAPSFERIDLGWESYQADDARTIWLDDVALSSQKIGCPP